MKARFAAVGLLVLLGLALAQATYSFTIDGKPAKLETLEKSGKVYVETQGCAKALGANVKFDAAKDSFVIVSSNWEATTKRGQCVRYVTATSDETTQRSP